MSTPRAAMKHFLAAYTLRDGSRGVLHVVATCSCDAVITAIDTFGAALAKCNVRPA